MTTTTTSMIDKAKHLDHGLLTRNCGKADPGPLAFALIIATVSITLLAAETGYWLLLTIPGILLLNRWNCRPRLNNFNIDQLVSSIRANIQGRYEFNISGEKIFLQKILEGGVVSKNVPATYVRYYFRHSSLEDDPKEREAFAILVADHYFLHTDHRL